MSSSTVHFWNHEDEQIVVVRAEWEHSDDRCYGSHGLYGLHLHITRRGKKAVKNYEVLVYQFASRPILQIPVLLDYLEGQGITDVAIVDDVEEGTPYIDIHSFDDKFVVTAPLLRPQFRSEIHDTLEEAKASAESMARCFVGYVRAGVINWWRGPIPEMSEVHPSDYIDA